MSISCNARPGRTNPTARAAGRPFEEYRRSQVRGATGRRRDGSDSGDRECGRSPYPWGHGRAARNGRGVAVEDRAAAGYETVRDRFTANRRGLHRPRAARHVRSREDGAANSRVMQTLDNHDLNVIVQVRKFGEGFDHPFLE
jgi:superfamily II DNA or RNA helicase